MNKQYVVALAVSLASILTAALWAGRAAAAQAPPRVIEVPAQLGTPKFAVEDKIVFEATDGTLALVDSTNGGVHLVIKRK
ncbi:MAG: hypothetical protein ACM3S5_11440 [Rhodospirillales bacterium]